MITQSCRRIVLRIIQVFGVTLSVGLSPATPAGNDLVLAIQPILDEAQTRKAFQPLCDYLGQAVGRACHVHTSPNFYAYWDTVRRGEEFNLVLDAAHFTDYRASKQGYEVLAKIPDTVSYSLVTTSDNFITDTAELVGKPVATFGVPSIGAARLNALFPNPMRQPVTVEIADTEAGMKLLRARRISAAILPTPMVSQLMARGEPLFVILTTEPIPHIAVSAAPSLPADMRQRLRQLLTQAHQNGAGQQMLKQIGFERFDPASATVYTGQARILREYWGY